MNFLKICLLVPFACLASSAIAQQGEVPQEQLPAPNETVESSSAPGPPGLRRGFSVGSPNAIKVGGGEGLRIGPPGMGVQYGGGQGVRYGTERFGVQYGGGEGVRYGTKNIGVQYGGGQILRWGTPGAGVKVGGGEGVRIGTRNHGIQFGTGHGLQIGRIRRSGN